MHIYLQWVAVFLYFVLKCVTIHSLSEFRKKNLSLKKLPTSSRYHLVPQRENGVKWFKNHLKDYKHQKPKPRSFDDEIIAIFIFSCGVAVTVFSAFCSCEKCQQYPTIHQGDVHVFFLSVKEQGLSDWLSSCICRAVPAALLLIVIIQDYRLQFL